MGMHRFVAAFIAGLSACASGAFADDTNGVVSFEVEDRIGVTRAVPFVAYNLDGTIATLSNDGKEVPIAAGDYLVEALDDPSLSSDATVASGQSVLARGEGGDGLWLTFKLSDEGEPRSLFFRPMPWPEARAILAATAQPNLPLTRRSLRSGATEAELAGALEAARALARMDLKFPGGDDKQVLERYYAWYQAVREQALPVLATFGADSDGETIAGALAGVTFLDTSTIAPLAYFEERYGMLASGEVARLAADESETDARRTGAIATLDQAGVPNAREALFAFASDKQRWRGLPPSSRSDLAEQLAPLEDPRAEAVFLDALAVAQEAVAAPGRNRGLGLLDDLPAAIAVRLLLTGTVEQQRAIVEALATARSFRSAEIAARLAMLVDEPFPFLRVIAVDQQSLFRRICPAFRLHVRSTVRETVIGMVDAMVEALTRDPAVDRNDAVSLAEGQSAVNLQPCMPSEKVADFAYNKKMPRVAVDSSRVMAPPEWMPPRMAPMGTEPLPVASPSDDIRRRVESLPPDLFGPAWQATPAGYWTLFRDERMAIHRAVTRTGDDIWNARVRDGIERRVYVLSHAEEGKHSGAIAGLLEVRPVDVDGRLGLEVRLDQQAYYFSDGLATKIATDGKLEAWLHHAYVIDHGRKLIDSIDLRRNGQPLQLQEGPASSEGVFPFSTDVPAGDLGGLVITIELALYDDRRRFDIDLFSTEFSHNRKPSP
jgi:hypothetical protein